MNAVARCALVAACMPAFVAGLALPLSAAGLPALELRRPAPDGALARDSQLAGALSLALRTHHL